MILRPFSYLNMQTIVPLPDGFVGHPLQHIASKAPCGISLMYKFILISKNLFCNRKHFKQLFCNIVIVLS